MSLASLNADLELELLGLVDGGCVPASPAETVEVGSGVVEDFDVNFLSDLLSDGDGQNASGFDWSTSASMPDSLSGDCALTTPPRSLDGGRLDTAAGPLDTDRASSIAESSSPSASSWPAPLTPVEDRGLLEEVGELTPDMTPEERKARRRAQMVINARLHRKRKKNELMELRDQVGALQRHLKSLRVQRGCVDSVADWEERAIAQRHKRRQAEELNKLLKRELLMQRGAASSLTGVLPIMPVGSELSMRHLLHTYTRLGRNPSLRSREYERLCTLSKLDLALQIVSQETETVLFDTPSISTRQIPAGPNEYAMTTMSVFAFKTHNIDRIYSDACTAILGCGSERPDFTLKSVQSDVVDLPAPQVRYGTTEALYTSDSTGEMVRMEGRGVSYYHVTDKYAALMWDFVDIDDLHPLKHETHMKRDAVGALIVRQEVCEDGVERVVCRSICTKIHRVNTLAPSREIVPFLVSGVQACSCHIYKQIRDGSATLEAAV